MKPDVALGDEALESCQVSSGAYMQPGGNTVKRFDQPQLTFLWFQAPVCALANSGVTLWSLGSELVTGWPLDLTGLIGYNDLGGNGNT